MPVPIALYFSVALAALSLVYYSVNTYNARRFVYVELSDVGSSVNDVSVLVPVYKETLDVFRRTIAPLNEQNVKFYVIGDRRYENITKRYGGVFVESDLKKRAKLSYAMPMVKTKYVMFLDSDTALPEGAVGRLLSCFSDDVGGVGANVTFDGTSLPALCSNFFARTGEVISRALSRATGNGFILCGTCAVYRTELVRPLVESEAFRSPKIIGIRSLLSDDRQLTNYVIKNDYKAVLNYNIHVVTQPQADMYLLAMQWSRWIRGGFTYFLQELTDGTAMKKGGLYVFDSAYMYALPVLLIVSVLLSYTHNLLPLYMEIAHNIMLLQLTHLSGNFIILNGIRVLGFSAAALFFVTVYDVINDRQNKHLILASGIVTAMCLSVISILALATFYRQDDWGTR